MSKKIKIDRELYDKFQDMMSNQRIIDTLIEENKELNNRVCEYRTSQMQLFDTNIKFFEENKILKELFDKEDDTQVIKYNGKLWRIVSGTHSFNPGEPDTLTVDTVLVREVNMDG